jgi:hypothetical protein
MDEVSFGPAREARLPPRYRRALIAAAAGVGAAGVVAAGIGLVVLTTGPRPAISPGRGASMPAAAPLPPGCTPAQLPTWPDLAALPAAKRAAALKIIIAAQLSGQCQVSR